MGHQKWTQNSNRNPFLGRTGLGPLAGRVSAETESGSRTPVTELPNIPRYRFFFGTWSKMGHAKLPQWNTRGPPTSCPAAPRGYLLVRLLPAAAGRYAFAAAASSNRRLLLPLCGIETARRLREDVRVQEICLSLVGDEVRETSHEHADPRLPRRAKIPASRTRGTRGASEVVLGSKLKVSSSCPLLSAVPQNC